MTGMIVSMVLAILSGIVINEFHIPLWHGLIIQTLGFWSAIAWTSRTKR